MPIFDQGYQHWSGKLSGPTWRWLAIARQGVRVGLKNRYVRMVLLVSWLPAVLLVMMLCAWGLLERNSDLVTPFLGLLANLFGQQTVTDPHHYRVEVWTICFHRFLQSQLFASMVLILLVGPNLISQDLRFNALPLYFSRPLRRIDYFLGKLGVIAVFLSLNIIVPAVIAYVFGMLFSLDITIIKDTFGLLLAMLTYGAVIVLSAGLLILALSSITRNSRYVSLLWVGVWFISFIVATSLESAEQRQRMRSIYRESRGQQAFDELLAVQMEATKTDWRPMVSYAENLSRIGEQLLGTNQCWEKLAQGFPPPARSRFLYSFLGPQYPWYWSAAVLVVVFGLSACILNFRIKSLDRLK